MFTRTLLALMLLSLSTPVSAALIDLTPPVQHASATASYTVATSTVSTVEGSYRLKGHLLALVPVSFLVSVKVYANGEIELDYPWYASVTVSRRQELETELKVAIDSVRLSSALGSVKGEGESAQPEFSAEEAALIQMEMKRVLAQ